jgi:hypothetical protein
VKLRSPNLLNDKALPSSTTQYLKPMGSTTSHISAFGRFLWFMAGTLVFLFVVTVLYEVLPWSDWFPNHEGIEELNERLAQQRVERKNQLEKELALWEEKNCALKKELTQLATKLPTPHPTPTEKRM